VQCGYGSFRSKIVFGCRPKSCVYRAGDVGHHGLYLDPHLGTLSLELSFDLVRGLRNQLLKGCAAIREIVPWSKIEESLFNSATDSLMRTYSIKELLRAVRQLPATSPQSDKLSKGGYESHQDHWIGWLKEYDGPGYYGRSDWSADARAVYQRLANGHILVWLNEAAGEDPKRIRAVITAMRRHGNGRAQTEAKIVRSHLPWEQVATLLFK
jgi:hypothetical protein